MTPPGSRGVRVKFCGMRRALDVRLALELGVDYVGFVLTPGTPRSVRGEDVRRIQGSVDCSGVQCVGVFREGTLHDIQRLVQQLSLDVVQWHSTRELEGVQDLPVPVIQMIPVAASGIVPPPVDPFDVAALPRSNLHALLLDTSTGSGRSGGTGLLAHPDALDALWRAVPRHLPLFLAGGLTPLNVGAMVARYRPDGVDVSTGIETRPGEKDPERMRAFLRALGEEHPS